MLGAARLPDETRRPHGAFLAAAQADDGGFAGRRGPGDLYYTGFALRGLGLLGSLDSATAERAAAFLHSRLDQPGTAIDGLSLASSAVLLEAAAGADVFAGISRTAAEFVEGISAPLRRGDGGYAKTAGSPHTSTYHTFLVLACRQLVGLPLESGAQVVEMVRSRCRDDGGFVELAQVPHSGTNPTAAAVALLGMFGAVDDPIRTRAIQFLRAMQGVEGGLRANTRVLLADLLSTFTGLTALAELGAPRAAAHAPMRRYVEALEQPSGGFRGGLWDDAPDVEYTFYGLGALALLAVEE